MSKETTKLTTIFEKLTAIQNELKAPKNQYNSFGKYKYRSQEDILEAVKPLLKKYGLMMILNDEIVQCENRYYIRASVTIHDGTSTVQNHALAREEETKKGMDASQITGTASSYARKYALNGMFLIDDTKDADTNEHQEMAKAKTKQSQPQQEPQQEPATNITTELGLMTQLTRELKTVGVDVHDEKFLKFVDEKTGVADHRNAVKTLDQIIKVNQVYKSVISSKKEKKDATN